jgi:lipopolysaccharide transport system permease protein
LTELSATRPTGSIAPDELVIGVRRLSLAATLQELWHHRELLWFLAWRDVRVRYSQTTLGILWAVVQPLGTAIVFAFFIGHIARPPSDGVPYSLFAFAGLVPWTFVSSAFIAASTSLSANAHLLTKVYFPRLAVPIASVLGALPDFLFSLVVLVLACALYGRVPDARWLAMLPLVVILAVATALGVGLWLSALTVTYRDVRHVVPFLAQLWMFATPIVYPATVLSARGQLLHAINPMVGVVETFRRALLHAGGTPTTALLIGTAIAGAVLVSGTLYFHKVEQTFADTA